MGVAERPAAEVGALDDVALQAIGVVSTMAAQPRTSAMYTQCSSCATLFRVSTRHLRQAHGLVRCCLCQETFDALPSLCESLPDGLENDQGASEPDVANGSSPSPASSAQPPASASSHAASAVEDFFVDLPPPSASIAVERARPIRRRFGTAGWSVAALLIVAVLVVQYAYVMREELGRYPRLRPWIETLCAAADCELPLLRDVSRVHILHRQVGQHPTLSDALLVKATVVNDTGFRQPYPQIKFSFLDPGGDVRASRWFSPDEYLVERRAAADVIAGMPPQEPVPIRLELADTEVHAADNFTIDFR